MDSVFEDSRLSVNKWTMNISSPFADNGTCALCQAPAVSKCAGCASVNYCNREHQKLDWPKHRVSCRSYKVKTSNTGHYAIALRDIKAGEVILSEAPLLIGPDLVRTGVLYCVGCSRFLRKFRPTQCCPQCKWPACKANCPGLIDELRHGNECKSLRIVTASLKSWVMEGLLPLRCFLLKTTNSKKWEAVQKIARPETNVTDDALRTSLAESVIFFENAVSRLLEKFPSQFQFGNNAVLATAKQIYAFLSAKGLLVRMPPGHEVDSLLGVYAVASRLEHSCVPNTRLAFEPVDVVDIGCETDKWRGRVTVRACKNISKGEHMTVTLVDPRQCTFERLRNMFNYRNSRCLCARCLDPTELGLHAGTMKCGRCSDWVLPTDPAIIELCPWRCRGCGETSCPNLIATLLLSFEEMCEKLQSEGVSLQERERYLAYLEQILHPHHRDCLRVKHLLCELYGFERNGRGITDISMENLKRKEALSLDVLQVYLNPVLQAEEHHIAAMIMHKGAARFEILRREFTRGMLSQSQAELFIEEHEALIRSALRIVPFDHPTLDALAETSLEYYAQLRSRFN